MLQCHYKKKEKKTLWDSNSPRIWKHIYSLQFNICSDIILIFQPNFLFHLPIPHRSNSLKCFNVWSFCLTAQLSGLYLGTKALRKLYVVTTKDWSTGSLCALNHNKITIINIYKIFQMCVKWPYEQNELSEYQNYTYTRPLLPSIWPCPARPMPVQWQREGQVLIRLMCRPVKWFVWNITRHCFDDLSNNSYYYHRYQRHL